MCKLLDLTRRRHLERHTLLGMILSGAVTTGSAGERAVQWLADDTEQNLFRNMLDMTLTIPASPDVLAQLVSNRQTWLQSIPQASAAATDIAGVVRCTFTSGATE